MCEITFVVPIYKTKNYVAPCVASLLRQGVDDFEILLIDDCSLDGTYEYAKELFKSDRRIRVLRTEKNGGPGLARNRGIEEARGEYICFCDVDDIYIDGGARAMLDVASQYHADVYHSRLLYLTVTETPPDDLSELSADELLCAGYLTKEEAKEENVAQLPGEIQTRIDGWLGRRYHWNIHGKLFRSSFLREQGIQFPGIRLGEDQVFTLHALLCAPVYLMQNKCFYVYRSGNINSFSRESKSIRIFLDGLSSLVGSIQWMDGMLAGIPYLEQRPEVKKALTDFQIFMIEDLFTIPQYQEIGRDVLEESEEVHRAFADAFGKQGAFVEKILFDAYDGEELRNQENKLYGPQGYVALRKLKAEIGEGIFCAL